MRAAEQHEQPSLAFQDAEGHEQTVVLGQDDRSLTIGRSPGTDICLAWDDGVSRIHAELERLGPDWTVADDGLSRNGTFVNGDRVARRLRLRDGDVLRIGSTRLTFHQPSKPLAETSKVEGSAPFALSEGQRRVLVALCRPYRSGAAHAAPATNKEIADELFLTVAGVKTHVRALFERFGVEDLPQNRKRARLVELAFASGTITQQDLDS